MYRKQVRRRRAVLALLIIGSFVLVGVDSYFNLRARDLVNWFDETFDAKGENSKLHRELESTRKEAVGAQAALDENAQLRKIVGLDRSGAIPSGYEEVTGRVIARSPTVWFSDVTIDVGSSDGVEVNDPVVNGDGLVGAVHAVTPAHVSGAASTGLTPAGTFTTYRAFALTYSAKPPSIE